MGNPLSKFCTRRSGIFRWLPAVWTPKRIETKCERLNRLHQKWFEKRLILADWNSEWILYVPSMALYYIYISYISHYLKKHPSPTHDATILQAQDAFSQLWLMEIASVKFSTWWQGAQATALASSDRMWLYKYLHSGNQTWLAGKSSIDGVPSWENRL